LLTAIEKIVEYKREEVPNDLAKGLVDLAVGEMIREKVEFLFFFFFAYLSQCNINDYFIY